ncbi:MAG: Hsp20/alpha crystallin family protein [Chloroflexi bacterium]|nr:Hsp20/alpha crystallin family protein [Chloroflexota bacterium]
MQKGNKESEIIGGTLDLSGLKIDLGKLLSSPEEVRGRLAELREKLKQAGGREVLSDEEWRRGQTSIGRHIRTHSSLGEREYHIETSSPTRRRGRGKVAEPSEVVEPAVDIFYEDQGIVIVVEVPGVELAELELKVEGDVLSLSTKPAARHSYRKEIRLGSQVEADSLKATCRNGILEVHLQRTS